MACEDLDRGIDWQFNENAGKGEIKNESPLSALRVLTVLGCSVDPATRRVVCPNESGVDWILQEDFCYGQRHNPAAQQQYRECYAALGRYPFCERVVACAGDERPDYGAAAVGIEWQVRANPESVLNARNAWAESKNYADPATSSWFRIQAMFHLLSGQRHNGRAMRIYRACYRDSPNRLFELVAAHG